MPDRLYVQKKENNTLHMYYAGFIFSIHVVVKISTYICEHEQRYMNFSRVKGHLLISCCFLSGAPTYNNNMRFD